MLLFAACSFGTSVYTSEEPHRQMSSIYELLKNEEEDNDDE